MLRGDQPLAGPRTVGFQVIEVGIVGRQGVFTVHRRREFGADALCAKGIHRRIGAETDPEPTLRIRGAPAQSGDEVPRRRGDEHVASVDSEVTGAPQRPGTRRTDQRHRGDVLRQPAVCPGVCRGRRTVRMAEHMVAAEVATVTGECVVHRVEGADVGVEHLAAGAGQARPGHPRGSRIVRGVVSQPGDRG